MRLAVAAYRTVFARPSFEGLNKALVRLGASGLGVLNSESARASGEAHLIEDLLPRLLSGVSAPVLFDIGAHDGAYSRALSARFPEGMIHAFEPHPKTFLRLAALTGPNVRCHNLGLGRHDASVALYDGVDSSGSEHASLYAEVLTDLHKRQASSVTVRIERIDTFAAREGIQSIDFMKIDAEGNEYAVLEGAVGLLSRKAVGSIHFEFNEMNVVSRTFLRDFRRVLDGYVLFRLLPQALLRLNDNPFMTELFAFQNILAVPRNRTDLLL
jgi:FkbM family methyltransferase